MLVVEDDDAIREMLARALGSELGAYTVVAPDGGEALKWIQRLTPSVVILDLNLPTIDGFELARRVKADPATRGTCLVAMTAMGPTERVRAEALAAGCDEFIAKPFRIDHLIDLVHSRLVEAEASPGSS